jgi:hypothetical protein
MRDHSWDVTPTSSKVQRLDPDEMDELCDYIKQNPAPVP